MPRELHLSVIGFPNSGDDERAQLAGALRSELLAGPVEDVNHPSAPLPEGAKGEALEWAQLVVAFGGTLPPLILAVRSWLRRGPDGVKVEVEIDGDVITLAEPTEAEQARLLEAWLRRHEHE